jgi:ABC-type transport system involved in multi-copper enzyme maturation permease subunit
MNVALRNVAVITRFTIYEQANRRLLWWLTGIALALVVGLAMVGVLHPLSGLTTQDAARLFARGAAGLYTLAALVILGMGIVGYDLDSGAVALFVTRPVSRGQYLTGRYLGNALTLGATVGIMGLGAFLTVLLSGRADWTLLYDFVVLAWNAAVILAVMVLFTVLGGMIAAAIGGFLTWEVVGNTYLVSGLIHSGVLTGLAAKLMTVFVIVAPHVLSSPLVAGQSTAVGGGEPFVMPGPTVPDFVWSFAWVAGALLLATVRFDRREL